MIEIMIDLQGGAKAPLYEKIYEYIKSEITDGRIPRGERLPSTRKASVDKTFGKAFVGKQKYRRNGI